VLGGGERGAHTACRVVYADSTKAYTAGELCIPVPPSVSVVGSPSWESVLAASPPHELTIARTRTSGSTERVFVAIPR